MLYVFFGTDIETIRTKSSALIETLKSKRPDASFFRLHKDNFSIEQLNTFTDSIGLFSSKYIVLLDNIFTGITEDKTGDSEEKVQYLKDKLSSLKNSEHIWIVVEDAHFGASAGKDLTEKQNEKLAEIQFTLKKHADKTEVHDQKKGVAQKSIQGTSIRGRSNGFGSDINSFTFTDAFCKKNKKMALFALNTLKTSGVAAEEVHGALWWQVKVLVQVAKKSTKGVSPFVIKKAQDALRVFSEAEVCTLAEDVVDMYHRAHAGECDLYNEMERLVMS